MFAAAGFGELVEAARAGIPPPRCSPGSRRISAARSGWSAARPRSGRAPRSTAAPEWTRSRSSQRRRAIPAAGGRSRRWRRRDPPWSKSLAARSSKRLQLWARGAFGRLRRPAPARAGAPSRPQPDPALRRNGVACDVRRRDRDDREDVVTPERPPCGAEPLLRELQPEHHGLAGDRRLRDLLESIALAELDAADALSLPGSAIMADTRSLPIRCRLRALRRAKPVVRSRVRGGANAFTGAGAPGPGSPSPNAPS